MMELRSGGLTAWYTTPDASAPAQQIAEDEKAGLMICVQPAHPSNGVDVFFREDGGPERFFRATLSRTDYAANQQFFRADFPPISPGTLVEYAPVIRQAGRRIDFRQGGRYPSSFFVQKGEKQAQTLIAAQNQLARYPYHLEHVARGDLIVEKNPAVIGKTPEGIRLNFRISGGSYQGKINGRPTHGSGDWLNVRHDGIGILDAKVTIITDDGATLLAIGSGTVDLGPDGYHIAEAGQYPTKAPLVEVVRFLASDPKYAWLNRLQCLGIGYAGTDSVCYDIYGVHSLCT